MTTIPRPLDQQAGFKSELQKWRAVRRRDARADGIFVFSVRTTGIYCRPSCKSRPPLRAHVAFHTSCADAERAGFRACKRCQPNGTSLAAHRTALVTRSCRTIEDGEEPPRLAELARAVHMSASHFQRVFVEETGLSPQAYFQAHRAEATRRNLQQARNVTDAIYQSGHGSNGRFYAKARQTLGMPPRRYLRGGQGETIRYALGHSTLGKVLVAAAGRGICAILLGDDVDRLIDDLRARFSKAQLAPGGNDFARTLKAVLALVENPRANRSLPLDIRGTIFQQKIWHALTRIPPGKTVAYAEIARRVGRPRAIRAVAAACAANPLAIAVPCHRVIRADGGLAGFRWGLERKRALLQREAAASEGRTNVSEIFLPKPAQAA